MPYPYNYAPNIYPTAPMYQPQVPSTSQVAPSQNYQPQIQNGGFIQVHSELEARNYPVAPGNSVTFKDENMPYVYTKTMGFSQLDRPIFEKYRLVKEEDIQPQQVAPVSEQTSTIEYALKSDIDTLRNMIINLKSELDGFTNRQNNKPKKDNKENETK